MANKFFSKLILAGAVAAAGVTALGTDAAQAANFRYSFTLPSAAPLNPGAVATGTFTVLDSRINPALGQQVLNLATPAEPVTLSFSEGGNAPYASYSSLTNVIGQAQAEFSFGNIVGINYQPFDASPYLSLSIALDTASIFGPNFETIQVSNLTGDGVRYERLAASGAIPTPALLPGLIGFGAAALRKRTKAA